MKHRSEVNRSKIKSQAKDHKFLSDIYAYDSNTRCCLHVLMKVFDESDYSELFLETRLNNNKMKVRLG